MKELEKPLVIEPGRKTSASVIWLHGLGADAHDYEPIVPELGDDLRSCVRFVFPFAPHRPVTINGGMVMRAWYDIGDADISRRADEDGVRESGEILSAMVDAEIERGVDPARVVLAGFSQGGAIALHTGLRYPRPLAGILALSAYLPLLEPTRAEASEANRKVPIFMAHGSQDPVIPLSLSERSREFLTGLGYVV
ncbi:MAG: alpha/beta fold hydrolase, partial [Gammaproteobacteria bacterium]|nr:alpha/beta fold hydrolase [Gammaproteobacteria bacterium]